MLHFSIPPWQICYNFLCQEQQFFLVHIFHILTFLIFMYTYIAELIIHRENLASCFTHLIDIDQSITGLKRLHSKKETEKCRESWSTPITKCGRSEKILRRGRLAWAHCQPEQPRALGRRHGGRQLAQGATLPVPCHTVVPHSTLRAALFLHRHTTSHLVSDTVSRTWTLFSCQQHLWRHPVKAHLELAKSRLVSGKEIWKKFNILVTFM